MAECLGSGDSYTEQCIDGVGAQKVATNSKDLLAQVARKLRARPKAGSVVEIRAGGSAANLHTRDHDAAISAQYFASGIDHGFIHPGALDFTDGINTAGGQQMALDCTLLSLQIVRDVVHKAHTSDGKGRARFADRGANPKGHVINC